MADMALEINSKSQSSHLSWKWQWLLDQRKMFSDRVDQYMSQLNDKFFTCADVVREQMIQAAISFLTQPVPDVEVATASEALKRPILQADVIDELKNVIQKLEHQTEERFQKQRDESSEMITVISERLTRVQEEAVASTTNLKASLDRLESQTQADIHGQLNVIEKLDQNIERIQKQVEQDRSTRDQGLKEMRDNFEKQNMKLKKDAELHQELQRKAEQDLNQRDQEMQEIKNAVDELEKQIKEHAESQQKFQEKRKEDKNKRDQQLQDVEHAFDELKKQRKEDAKQLQEHRKIILELRSSQQQALKAYASHLAHLNPSSTRPTQSPVNQGAATAHKSLSQPQSKKPNAATVLSSFTTSHGMDYLVVLDRGLVLMASYVAHDGGHKDYLMLYNDQGELLHKLELIGCKSTHEDLHILAVILEPQVALVTNENKRLHLMDVTQSGISEQSCHQLCQKYRAISAVDSKTLAGVFGMPPIGVDLIDLKGQVLTSLGLDHNIFDICGTGDGGIICIGDGCISRYDVNTQTKIFCLKDQQVCKMSYLPSSDSIVVCDSHSKDLSLLDGQSGAFITCLFKNLTSVLGAEVKYLSVNTSVCVCASKDKKKISFLRLL